MPSPLPVPDIDLVVPTEDDRTVRIGATSPAAAAAPATTRDGTLSGAGIGHYQVRELLGRGSFGEVYRAIDPRLARDVAIKVAEPGIAADPEARALFWNEARIQARLEHANIVPIYDLLETPDQLVMVMRLIHGVDLDKRLRQMVRPFIPADALVLLQHVSAALGTAHDRGVVHQDLKPGNIRLTPAGEAVVLDFGVARITGHTTAALTGSGGTPAYMSPEQIRGDPIDARSDIYALAMTLYKTLTGHHPFEHAGDLGELLAWQVERDPESPTRFNAGLPEALAETILQGLAKNPRERFRACDEFTAAVASAIGAAGSVPVGESDGRWDPRAPCSLEAEVLVHGQPPLRARVVDLSTTGAALQCSRPLQGGANADLIMRIPLKASEHVVRCAMQVQRVERDEGSGAIRTGVALKALGDYDRTVIGDLVRAILVYRGTP